MLYKIRTSRGFSDVIPPRCRTGRYVTVSLPVTYEIAETFPDRIRPVAEVTKEVAGTPETVLLCYDTALGFLTRTPLTPQDLQTRLAPQEAHSATPLESLPPQTADVQQRMAQCRLDIQARASAYILAGSTVYERAAEPCYTVELEHSFGGGHLALRVDEIPARTPEAYGLDRTHRDRWWHTVRCFNATDLPGVRRFVAAVQQARAREDREPWPVYERGTIAVLVPDVFAFEADAWHAPASAPACRRNSPRSRRSSNRRKTPRPVGSPPERARLATHVRQQIRALIAQIEALDLTARNPSPSRPDSPM